MRYQTDITAGSLKVPESRNIAGLLLDDLDDSGWKRALFVDNVLQVRSPTTAKRLRTLIRRRLEPMGPELWEMVRDGSLRVASHACLAAAVRRSFLLGDFLDLVVRELYRASPPKLSRQLWEDYIAACRGRDSKMPVWSASTIYRLRSSVFQILQQAGYIDDTRSLTLQTMHISPEVLSYLYSHEESYILRCLLVTP